jgi:putative endopeptidase
MTNTIKRRKPKKGHITRKTKEIHLPKAIPPFPLVPPVQSLKRPGQDFYLYVNGNWLQHAKTPKYRSAFGVSEELEEIIKEKLTILLEKAMVHTKRGPSSRDSLLKAFEQVGRFGLSALRPSVQSKSIHLLKQMISDVNCMKTQQDISRMLAVFVKHRITSLLSFYMYYEPGKEILSRCAISPGQLGMPDTSYYLQAEARQTNTLELYGSMLDKVGKLLDLDQKLSDVIQIEFLFANEIEKNKYQEELILKGDSLQQKYKNFDWAVFWKELGYSDWKTHILKVNPPGWLKSVDRQIGLLSMDHWKLLLNTHLILHALPLLPPPYDDIHSEFYEKHLRGQTTKLPQKELTVRLLEEWMPSTMSKLYLKYFVPKTLKGEATDFVHFIRRAAIERISNTEWFSTKTKEKATEKVRKMKLGIAYPKKLKPIPSVHLQTDNLFQNILLLGEEHNRNELKSANQVIHIENEWDEGIYTVNAYYYSEVNQLILPAGSLQWPFYNSDAPLGWNYGGLGAVIGHEMTHAFDSDGKEYNWEGKKEKWWTVQDNREYSKRTKALIELYNNARILNRPVNGTLTLNENISDLGGLAIALDALNLECATKKVSPEMKLEAYRNFFISYAVSWRIKEKPEKMIQGLFMDRHAPAPLRVNLIVSQFDEWYDAFQIQVNDKLYIPPEERIRIF